MSKSEKAKTKTHTVAAVIAFFSEIIRFIVIPLVLLNVLIGAYPLLSHETVTQMASGLMVFGALVAIFVAMETYFPKGSVLKFIFGVLAIATLCLWFWYLLNSGSIRFSMGALQVAINITGLAFVILAAVAIKGLLPLAQFFVYRGDLRRAKVAVASADAPVQKAQATTVSPPSVAPSSAEEEPPPPEDFTVTCPICKWRIPATDDVCPKCGAWIRQKMKIG